MVFAAAGTIGVEAACKLGGAYGTWVMLAAVFVLLLIFYTVLLRFLSSRAFNSAKLIDVLNTITEGRALNEGASASCGSLDPQLKDSLQRLSDSYSALQRHRHSAQMVFANMADGMIIVGGDGVITAFNRAAGQVFCRSEEEVVGRKIEDVDLHPEVARVAYECIASRAAHGSEIKLPGVPCRVISIHSAFYRSIDDSSHYVMIILHDLTEIRRHENNQKEFVSNVSHELRTPITSIRTTAEVLLCGAKNDEAVADRFLSTIISESDRLSALISDLMEIAKRDAGVIKTDKINIKTADIINKAVDVLRPQAEQKDVTIDVAVENGLIVYCDEMQTVQLIRNLVDNAVKYTPSGGSVKVLARADADRDGVMISVKDTGIGIPHGEIDRIFERFYRVDKARSRRMGGTGLGLAIVKDIIDAHNGEILVDSRLGKGSEFVVKLSGEMRE